MAVGGNPFAIDTRGTRSLQFLGRWTLDAGRWEFDPLGVGEIFFENFLVSSTHEVFILVEEFLQGRRSFCGWKITKEPLKDPEDPQKTLNHKKRDLSTFLTLFILKKFRGHPLAHSLDAGRWKIPPRSMCRLHVGC